MSAPVTTEPTRDPSPFAAPDIEVDQRADGTLVLRSRVPLAAGPSTLGEMLAANARAHPDHPLLAERDAAGSWRRVSHGEAWAAARAIGQALVDRGLDAARGVACLSGNGIDHALVQFGCLLAGVPFTPVSVAYSLLSEDHVKLRQVLARARPGLVFVADPAPFAGALRDAALRPDVEVASISGGAGTTPIAELRATTPGASLDAATAAVGPDTVAKYLFTSGSTGIPKAVPTTHRMLCANQQSLRQVWPFTTARPPVLVDWLPWSHTFGGSHNFNLVLRTGGTMYIDAGKPTPALVDTTIANLRAISPTIYFNVPAGYAALLPHLERDADLAASFFGELEVLFYAAAALPLDTWQRLDAVARATLGRPVVMTSAWGATETAPGATTAHFPLDGPGNIGVPMPGVEVKLAPAGTKYELRVRGPNVAAGYLDEPELSAAAFDDEGFYRMGDAGRLADPADPAAGIVFDGRLAEDFKLTTGTWVSVGTVRPALVSAGAPWILDAVITGHDREEVGALVWVTPAAADEAALADRLAERLAAYNAAAGGSSHQVHRLLVLEEPPQIDGNEITDKGYINQRAVLERRAAAVEHLHAGGAGVITIR